MQTLDCYYTVVLLCRLVSGFEVHEDQGKQYMQKMLQGLSFRSMYGKHSLLMFNSWRMLFMRTFDKPRVQCSYKYCICIVFLKTK